MIITINKHVLTGMIILLSFHCTFVCHLNHDTLHHHRFHLHQRGPLVGCWQVSSQQCCHDSRTRGFGNSGSCGRALFDNFVNYT